MSAYLFAHNLTQASSKLKFFITPFLSISLFSLSLSLVVTDGIYVLQVLADYNKSLVCFENVLKLSASFNEARLRYHAVVCHQKVERALRQQHDSLQKTLEELQGYQRAQELWLQQQQKLLNEQAPPGVLLEQRLLYREHKIREIIDESINNGGGAGGGGGAGSAPSSGAASGNGSGPNAATNGGGKSASRGGSGSAAATATAAGNVVVRHVASEACVGGAGGGAAQDVKQGAAADATTADADGRSGGCTRGDAILIPVTFT